MIQLRFGVTSSDVTVALSKYCISWYMIKHQTNMLVPNQNGLSWSGQFPENPKEGGKPSAACRETICTRMSTKLWLPMPLIFIAHKSILHSICVSDLKEWTAFLHVLDDSGSSVESKNVICQSHVKVVHQINHTYSHHFHA